MKTKNTLCLAAALLACTGTAIAAAPQDADSVKEGFNVQGEVKIRYRSDHNRNNQFGNDDHQGMREILLLNMTQSLDRHTELYARYSYVNAPDKLTDHYAADVVEGGKNHYSSLDQYGIHYKNAGWDYRLGAQNLTLGATGLLYDDTRFYGRHIFNHALTVSGKVGRVSVQGALSQSNYESGLDNDKIYYIHGSIPVNRSTFGFGYAHASYGAETAAAKVENGDSGMNYYTADYSYKLTDNLFFHSEFIKSSASDNNKGINLVLFHKFDEKNNGGIAWFRVEGQAAIQQESQGNMTYQWGNAQGYGIFFNHKINKDMTLSFTDFEMKKIDEISADNPSGMPGDQNTLRIDYSYKF